MPRKYTKCALFSLVIMLWLHGCAVDSGGGGGGGDQSSSSVTVSTDDEITINQSFADDAEASREPNVEFITAFSRRVSVTVDFALTPEEQQQGLSGIQTPLQDFTGLLFIFAEAGFYSFTLEQTFIPLDIIFLDANRRVVEVINNAEPETTGPYLPRERALYVLEVNGGFAEENGITRGDVAIFNNFDPQVVLLDALLGLQNEMDQAAMENEVITAIEAASVEDLP